MSDDILEIIDVALQADGQREITDDEADAFFLQAVECSDDSVKRMQKRFVEKTLNNTIKTPIIEAENIPFGRWIEQARRQSNLSAESIETAINKRSPYLEKLESGALMPWKMPAADIAELVRLFQIHIKALRQMISASLTVNQTTLAGDVIARSEGGKATKDRGDATKKALDMFLARNAKKVDLDPSIEIWLESIRENLEKRDNHDLIQ